MNKAAKNKNYLLNKRLFIEIFCLILIFMVFETKKTFAQVLSLSPNSGSKTINTEFSVDLNIDTKGLAVSGAEAKLTFDANKLEVVAVDKGTFFKDEAHNIGTGVLYVAGLFPSQFETKTGSGKIATIVFKGKAAGAAQVNFVCSPQTNDSNILDASINDVINCPAIVQAEYNITGSGGAPAATVTPSPLISPTITPRITSVPTRTPPVSGNSLPTNFAFMAGGLLMILGIVALAL